MLYFIGFVIDCLVWVVGKKVLLHLFAISRPGKNRGKKPLVTLVTNWAFLIKTDAKQRKNPGTIKNKKEIEGFLSRMHLS